MQGIFEGIWMILIDGVKFDLHLYDDEKELEEMIKEHSKEIFGEDSIYFGLKKQLASESDVKSIPDGYVITLKKPYRWYIVEGELARHPLHEHITNQLNKFMVGIKNLGTQRELVNALYAKIKEDEVKRVKTETKIGSPEIKGFLLDLIEKPPEIVVIIDQGGRNVEEACGQLKVQPIVREFKTFVKEHDQSIHAHLFESVSDVDKENGKNEATPRTLREITPIQKGYLAFFEEVAARFKERVPEAHPAPKPRYYCQIPTRLGSVHFEWMFGGNPRNRLGVELHFEKGDKEANVRLLREMMKSKNEIETKAGEKVVFEENWGKTAARLYLLKQEGNLTEDLKKWAIEKMAILYRLLQPKLEQLK